MLLIQKGFLLKKHFLIWTYSSFNDLKSAWFEYAKRYPDQLGKRKELETLRLNRQIGLAQPYRAFLNKFVSFWTKSCSFLIPFKNLKIKYNCRSDKSASLVEPEEPPQSWEVTSLLGVLYSQFCLERRMQFLRREITHSWYFD